MPTRHTSTCTPILSYSQINNTSTTIFFLFIFSLDKRTRTPCGVTLLYYSTPSFLVDNGMEEVRVASCGVTILLMSHEISWICNAMEHDLTHPLGNLNYTNTHFQVSWLTMEWKNARTPVLVLVVLLY